ncbi:MAG: hypothetical protein A2086_06830 [Spirochaetes bacterium GWD1_27_9]|nr:MAG: hypothetical protein A2Z98_09210 [Spirochaetes bacterium GWB1_27_13]OHD24782.1 MAG: hypothetical protein A2Y34_05830 [Spirochaetes bacterium GWC1_27_15]OHD44461.1 MAG: hypothetical protein A2086_06830 [Spirochaetes bacterium GWD1_27_9]
MKILKQIFDFFRRFFLIIIKSFSKFHEDQGFLVSSALAYKTIFAIIPVFAVFIGIFSAFPSFIQYKERFFDFLLHYMIPTSVNDAIIWINTFLKNTKTIGTIGTIALIYVSLDLFITLDNQVNRIWTSNMSRSILHKILIYWALLSVTPILLVGYFYYSGVLHTILTPFSQLGFLQEYFYIGISFVLLEAFFFFLFYVIPNTKVNIIKAFIISSVVSVIWTLLRYFFTYYTKIFVTNWVIYGSIAAILFFMMWIYLNWIILLLGMEFLYVWQSKYYLGIFNNVKDFYLFDICLIILILKEFHKDFKGKGHGLSASDISANLSYNRKNTEEILLLLEKEELLVTKLKGDKKFYITKDISNMKLSEIEKVINNKFFYKNFSNSSDFQSLYDKISKLYYQKKDEFYLGKILY